MINSRQKNSLLNIVSSPFFLAIPIAIALILLLPNPTSKYTVRLKQKAFASKANSFESFYDLNGNGSDDRVVAFHNPITGNAAIKVLTNENVNVDQWNFNGYFQKLQEYFFCTDIDKDGFPEIYVFYYKDDSVFMAGIQPYPDRKTLFNRKFITTIWQRNGNIDFCINNFQTADLNGDGFDELIFAISAGYSRQPRAIFIYERKKNSITHTPSTGAKVGRVIVNDLDNDSIPEIYFGTSASGNIHDSMNIPYNDYSSWLMGFSNELKFLFKPIENKQYPSNTQICKFETKEGKKLIATLFNNAATKQFRLIFFGADGKIELDKTEEVIHKGDIVKQLLMKSVTVDNKPLLFIGNINNYFVFYDKNLSLIKIKKPVPEDIFFISSGDLNKDGKDEFIFGSATQDFIFILDNHFKNPVKVATNANPHVGAIPNIGIKHNKAKPNEFYIHQNDFFTFYTYDYNPLYSLKVPIWILIYGITAFILWLTHRIQQVQIKRRQKIEETINNLQMKTIKSQMNPHFMFNVLNGLANNVANGNSKEAYNQILRFSTLLRSMMKKTDKIDITIEDEIEFVNNYLELEKFRFKDNFEFKINVADDVNKNIKIPKMIIQLLVENSIKHGLSNKEGVKRLKVVVTSQNNNTVITVEDNGVGRKQAMETTRDTGKGLKLINNMIKLNRKLGGNNITLSYTDLYDDGGKAAGTRVEVTIFPNSAKKVKG